jgi:hypothetical protein
MFWSAGSVTCGRLSNTFCHSVKLLLPPLDIGERETHSSNRKQGMPTEIVWNRFSLIREFWKAEIRNWLVLTLPPSKEKDD